MLRAGAVDPRRRSTLHDFDAMNGLRIDFLEVTLHDNAVDDDEGRAVHTVGRRVTEDDRWAQSRFPRNARHHRLLQRIFRPHTPFLRGL